MQMFDKFLQNIYFLGSVAWLEALYIVQGRQLLQRTLERRKSDAEPPRCFAQKKLSHIEMHRAEKADKAEKEEGSGRVRPEEGTCTAAGDSRDP